MIWLMSAAFVIAYAASLGTLVIALIRTFRERHLLVRGAFAHPLDWHL
jgi:hypothetical protein